MGVFDVRVLREPPAGWEALVAADPCATAAHRGPLCAVLAQTLGMAPRFLAVESEGRLVGGVPVAIERRAGFHWIHALPFLLPGAPLAAEGTRSAVDAAVARGLATLQRELCAVGGEWSLYRACEPPPAADVVEAPGGETRMVEAAVVDLDGGWEAARARMERKTRQSIHSAFSSGLRFAEEPEAVGEAYALYLAQARKWRGHRARPLELSRRLLATPGPGGAAGASAAPAPLARLFTVRDGRGLLSAVLVLDHPREVMPWWSGTHPDARARQAATYLLGSVVEWAAQAGCARVNLGGSAGVPAVAAFKQALGARILHHPVRWLDARHATPAGRLVAAAQGAMRRRRARGEAA